MLPNPERDKRYLQQIRYYIDNKLTKPKSEFDNLPVCPYVQRYRDSIQIKIAHNSPYEILSWALRNWDEDQTAWVYGFYLEQTPSAAMTEKVCDGFAEQFNQIGATVLLDHPYYTEPVGGVYTGFGKGVLIVIQNTKLLQNARTQLLKTAYYANWSNDDLRDLAD